MWTAVWTVLWYRTPIPRFENARSLQQGDCLDHSATNSHIPHMNKAQWIKLCVLSMPAAIFPYPNRNSWCATKIYSFSLWVILHYILYITYMFNRCWTQNLFAILSRYAVGTITMELKWIHNVTTDRFVLTAASFRFCKVAGRLRLITRFPIITTGAIAGEVCAKFSSFLADSMARAFVLTWLGNKRCTMKGICKCSCLKCVTFFQKTINRMSSPFKLALPFAIHSAFSGTIC